MQEGTLSPEFGFKAGTTQAEYFDRSQRIFQEALVGVNLTSERKGRLEILFGEVQRAYIQDPQVNLYGRDVLGQGLRLARFREHGVSKERIFGERKKLEVTCGKLVDSLEPHVSQLPSQKEIAEAASRMAVEIQEMKKIGLKQPDLTWAMTKFLMKSDKGKARVGCIVGAGVLAALICVGAVFVEGVVYKGQHFKGGETSPENIALILKQEDFNRLEGLFYPLQKGWENPNQPSEVAIYYQEVWGIDVYKDLGGWLDKNPKPSEDDKKRFVDKLLMNRKPNFEGGYLEWYNQKWLPRQKTPTL